MGIRNGAGRMKYKIKNCPHFDDYFWENPSCNVHPKDCQNVENCLLRKIFDTCNETLTQFKDVNLALKIYSLFEIERID